MKIYLNFKSGLKTLLKVEYIMLTQIASWNISRSTIIDQKNSNIRKKKQIKNQKKRRKETIHMPSSQAWDKDQSKQYLPRRKESVCCIYLA